MPRKQSQAKSATGGSHTLSDRGLVAIQFTASPEERKLLRAAAVEAEAGSLAEWLRRATVEAAKKILDNSSN